MKKLVVFLLLFGAHIVRADNLSNKLMNLNKVDIMNSLHVLHAQGKISDQDYNKAIKELEDMNDKQIHTLIRKGEQIAKKKLKKKNKGE